jgi:peptidoglycan/LPS O-acetylase OafA/YrhL
VKGDKIMTDTGRAVAAGSRIYWLDNLRTCMIFLVVLLHAGIVYESGGGGALFWIVDDPATNRLSDILNLILDIVVMPAIFFVSGFFAALSIQKKSGWSFLKTRFRRLIVPWLFAVFTLMPLYKFLFLHSRNIPQESWTTYFHFSNGIFSQSWLWFLPVLFLLDFLYLVLSKAKIELSRIGLKNSALAATLIGFAYLVCMYFLDAEGWTKTAWIDFQNERLLIYFMIFLLGSQCRNLGVFESKVTSKKLYAVLLCTAWIPVYLYIRFYENSLLRPGKYVVSELADAMVIRITLLMSLFFLLFVVINTFRYYLNRQGKMSKELNKNSYGVYIIHTIVLGGIAYALLYTTIPSLLKFLLLTVFTYAACNLIVYFYRTVIKSKILFILTEGKK